MRESARNAPNAGAATPGRKEERGPKGREKCLCKVKGAEKRPHWQENREQWV